MFVSTSYVFVVRLLQMKRKRERFNFNVYIRFEMHLCISFKIPLSVTVDN